MKDQQQNHLGKTEKSASPNQQQEPEPSREAFVPAFVFHPAEVIREELLARGWDLATLATRALGNHPHVDATSADAWRSERLGWELYMACAGAEEGMRLGAKSAARLERAFGISAEMWLRMENMWWNAPPERRSPVTDNEDLLSAEIAAEIKTFCDRIERERNLSGDAA